MDRDDDDIDSILTVALPRETYEWLQQVSRDTGSPPETLVASIVCDVVRDDLAQNQTLH
jgi:hypothetical protein